MAGCKQRITACAAARQSLREKQEMTDPFDLERFVSAQEPVFDTVLNELRAGRKRTHW